MKTCADKRRKIRERYCETDRGVDRKIDTGRQTEA